MNEKLFSVRQSELTKGMWFMMENELIIKIKYGINGKNELQRMVDRRNEK